MKKVFVIITGLSMVVACNNAGFTGRTPERMQASTPTPQPAQPTPQPQQTPVTTTTATPSGPGFLDVIGGWINGLPNIDINKPKPNEIEFGSWSKVFHIGDGEMTNSSCKLGVVFYPTRGSDYYFEFEVLEDVSTVTVNLGRVCGIDYADTNHAAITQGTNYLQKQLIPLNASKLTLPTMTLNRGLYTVLVQSAPNPNKNNDRDDYLVGRVKITSNKPLKAGRVGARD